MSLDYIRYLQQGQQRKHLQIPFGVRVRYFDKILKRKFVREWTENAQVYIPDKSQTR